MSKIVYINFRTKIEQKAYDKLTRICKILEPDNIVANEPEIYKGQRTLYAIVNPVSTVIAKNESIVLGHCVCRKEWHTPLNPVEDGSYALIRGNTEMTEIVSDSVGSRALWYYSDIEIFMASTSQRAIILFLENFKFNENVIPWMLSTGSLGPDFSWDKRISKLKPNASVVLHKATWKLEEKIEEIVVSQIKRTNSEHKKILSNAIKSTFKNFSVDFKKWILPLSGGYDSRAILYLLRDTVQNTKEIHAITWGLAESINKEGNDAYVAKQVAKAIGIKHKYYHTNISKESAKIILNRFIENGEGRIDHISGYSDGFAIWKTLFENGVKGIIRGDEGFGWLPMASSLRVRYHLGFALCTDFLNLSDYKNYGIPKQEIPKYLLQHESESLYAWRDRLYHQYRIPTVLSALSDLKLGYVEQLTPLMSDNIIQTVRTLPDHLRTQKLLFKRIMKDFRPQFKYASDSATSTPQNILKSSDMVFYLKKELKSDYATSIFSKEFIKKVIKDSKIVDGRKPRPSVVHRLRIMFIKYAPQWAKKRFSSNRILSVDPNVLLLRVYIVIHMHRLLTQDKDHFMRKSF